MYPGIYIYIYIYRDTFQKYQAKQTQKIPDLLDPPGSQMGSNQEQGGQSNGGRNGVERIYKNQYRWLDICW